MSDKVIDTDKLNAFMSAGWSWDGGKGSTSVYELMLHETVDPDTLSRVYSVDPVDFYNELKEKINSDAPYTIRCRAEIDGNIVVVPSIVNTYVAAAELISLTFMFGENWLKLVIASDGTVSVTE